MLSSVKTVNTNKIKNFSKKYQENLSFCYNLAQSYSKCIYYVFVEYTHHRLEIIKHTSAQSQTPKRLNARLINPY